MAGSASTGLVLAFSLSIPRKQPPTQAAMITISDMPQASRTPVKMWGRLAGRTMPLNISSSVAPREREARIRLVSMPSSAANGSSSGGLADQRRARGRFRDAAAYRLTNRSGNGGRSRRAGRVAACGDIAQPQLLAGVFALNRGCAFDHFSQ